MVVSVKRENAPVIWQSSSGNNSVSIAVAPHPFDQFVQILQELGADVRVFGHDDVRLVALSFLLSPNFEDKLLFVHRPLNHLPNRVLFHHHVLVRQVNLLWLEK